MDKLMQVTAELPDLSALEQEMARRGVEERARGLVRSIHCRAMRAPAWERQRPALEIRRLIRTFGTK
jgi:hypothetical protein